jgi:hypothetical protein
MTPAEHLRVAAHLRQLADNPKAQDLAVRHEQLAQIIQASTPQGRNPEVERAQ